MKVTKRRHKIIGNIKNMKNKKITRKTRSMGYINGSKGTKKIESMGYINNRKSRKRRNIRKSKKRRTIIKHRKSKKNAGGLGLKERKRLEAQKEKLLNDIKEWEKKIRKAQLEEKEDQEEKLKIKLANLKAERNIVQHTLDEDTANSAAISNRNRLDELCDELFKNFEEKKNNHLTRLNNMLIDYKNIEVIANEKKAELTDDATRTIISVIKIQQDNVSTNVINRLRTADSIARPAHAHVPAAITNIERNFFNLTPTYGTPASMTSTTTRRELEYTNFMRKIYLNGYENGTKTRLDYNNAADAKFYYDLIDRIEPDFSKLKTYLETYISTEIPDRVQITHELKGTEGDPYHIFKFYEHGYMGDDDLFHLTIHTSREVFESDKTDKFNGGKIHLKKSVRDPAGKYATQYETCTNLRPYIFTKIPGLDLIGPNRCLQFIPIYPKHSADYVATLADKLKLVIVKGVNEFIFENQIDDEASRDRRVKDEKELITAKHTAAQAFFKNYITTLSNRSIIMLRRNLIRRVINVIKDELEAFTKFITNTDELDKNLFNKNLFEECLEKSHDPKFKNILDEINAMMLEVKTKINDTEAFITTEIPTTGPSDATIDRLNTDARDKYGEFLDGDFLDGDFLTNLETFRNNALANPEQIVREDELTPFNTHVDRLNEALVNLKLAATTRNTPGEGTSASTAEEQVDQPPSEKKEGKRRVVDPLVMAALELRSLEKPEPIGNKKGSKTKKSGQGKRLNKITRKKIK